MGVLDDRKPTGKIVRVLSVDKVDIRTAHYSVDGCILGMHYHENPHISFLLKGGDIESRNTLSYERKAGDLYFYRAGEKHRTVFRQPFSININIEFSKGFFEKYEFSEFQIGAAIRENVDAKFLLLKILQETQTNDACSITSIEMLIFNLIESSNDLSNLNKPKWVLSLRDLLNDRWSEQLTLTELAAAIGVHPVTISKSFRKYFSCTLGEYLRKLKIEKSISLIKNSQLQLTEIALHCGFADHSHFTRNFKQMTGFLPKDYRKY